jgi:transcriptional regulator with XRE-family HTH domain
VGVASPVFTAPDAEHAVRALHELDGGELLASLSRNLSDALSGSDAATRRYVADYRRLTGALLAAGRDLRPDLIVQNGRALTLRDGKGRPAEALIGVLENGSAEAPFTNWGAGDLALHEAAALHLANRLRAILGLSVLPEPPSTPAVEDDVAAQRFLRRVRFHLNHPDSENPLRRIMDAFALSKTDVARLFGVSRQAVDGWLAGGVPPERQEKIATLLALCDVLQRKLKADRLPGVARRPADAYGGRTMLELIAAGRHGELLQSVRDSFDWQNAA